jgi:hypothetical protein
MHSLCLSDTLKQALKPLRNKLGDKVSRLFSNAMLCIFPEDTNCLFTSIGCHGNSSNHLHELQLRLICPVFSALSHPWVVQMQFINSGIEFVIE